MFLIFTYGLGTSEVNGFNLCPFPPQRIITIRFFLNFPIFKVIIYYTNYKVRLLKF